MKKFDVIIKIEGETASSEIKALIDLFPTELAFVYLEQYFINGPGWTVLKNLEFDQSLYSRIDDFTQKIHLELVRDYDYRVGPMSVSIISDPILAALEGANYHKEYSILNKSSYHWSDRLKRHFNEYRFQYELNELRMKASNMPIMLVKFSEEFQKLINDEDE